MQSDPRFANYTTYIMTPYVQFMESAGARVVPLIMGEPEEVTLEKLRKLDGVLMPGGGGDYYDYGEFIYKYIKDQNDIGHYYPLWGTCLGFEFLTGYASGIGK